ncbi:MAG TPA: hypothetical protein VNF29_10125, partial [Candidatus Binataceae bacterium]|nr:hypothetical protein [Candidatus Binataceae bacterium]
QDAKRFWQRWKPTQPIDGFTALLVLVGVAYTFFAGAQWLIMKKTLKVTERAYLYIGPITLDNSNGVIALPLENSGKLPASDPDLLGCEIREHWPEGSQVDFVPLNIQTHDSQVPPGKGYRTYVLEPTHWSQSEIAAVNNRDETIFIGLRLKYGDGLGHIVDDYGYCVETLYDKTTHKMNWVDCVPGTLTILLARGAAAREQQAPPQQPNAQPNALPAFP